MIRRLLTLTEQLSPLPTEVELTMRIEYYDNVPPDYEPPLFKEFEGQDIELTVHENIGTVVSQFHRVDLMVGFQEAKQSAQGAEKETIPPASVPFDTMFDSGRHSDADTEDGLLSQDDDVNMDSPASLPLAQVRKRDVTSRSQASTKWDIPMDIDELDLASTQPIISLSQSLTDEIVSSSQRVTRAQLLEILNPAQEAEEQPTIDVKCVCTFDREWETIECTTCHQGSHRPCYGNLITPFECYNCRNIPEQAYLKAVQVRACYYAISITARPTLATLSSNLGASMPDTQRLVSHLRQLGICPAKRINISKDRKLIEPWLDDSVIEALALPTPAPTPKPKVRNLMQGKKRKISTVINDVQVL